MSSQASSGGVSLTGCLFLIFLTLKLAEVGAVAHWSWWWVTSPLWLPLAVALPIVFLILIVKTIAEWARDRARIRRMMRD